MTGQRRKGKRPIPFKVYTHLYLFKLNNLKKRFDIVVFDKYGNINVLIECKSPSVTLNQKSLDQLVIYNMELASNLSTKELP